MDNLSAYAAPGLGRVSGACVRRRSPLTFDRQLLLRLLFDGLQLSLHDVSKGGAPKEKKKKKKKKGMADLLSQNDFT
jgi:hypothetical protein